MYVKMDGGVVVARAFVARAYSDNSETELIAAFQYHGVAHDFAKQQLADDIGRGCLVSYYVVCNTYDGIVSIYKYRKPEES